MRSMKKDTLAYQLGVRPLAQPVVREAEHLPTVVKALASAKNKGLGLHTGQVMEKTVGSPEEDAVTFYMLNHAVSLVRQRVHPLEPLGDYLPILNTYNREIGLKAERMFNYLLVICTRESRHNHASESSGVMKAMWSKYGEQIKDFHIYIRGTSSTESVNRLISKTPETTLGQYTKFLAEVFHEGNWSGGYGGKAWAKVAEVLRDYVWGTISAEMMMDTAFTLAHNNGPIFNKGVFFTGYSSNLYKILDVQRSGQIPQLVKQLSYSSESPITFYWELCRSFFPEFDGEVDWYKVEALGSLHSYPSEKAAQKKTGGSFKSTDPKDWSAKGSVSKKKAGTPVPDYQSPNTIKVCHGLTLTKEDVR